MGRLAFLVPCLFALSGRSALATGCDFERLDATAATKEAVETASRPLVIRGLTAQWAASQKWSSSLSFLELYGDLEGYARDHDQLELRDVDVSVGTYLANESGAQSALGLSPSAAFFVNDYEDSRLLDRLDRDWSTPPQLQDFAALRVFSMERPRAGVTFHRHESSWQALVAGRKAWFLAEPSVKAVPQTSPCSFVEDGVPAAVERCELEAGEVIFVPGGWWHATCSVSEEPSLAIGSVGSTRDWPSSVLSARHGLTGSLKELGNGALAETIASGEGIIQGGETPLFMAAAFGHVEAARLLLDRHLDPNTKRSDGRTALHEAARRGNVPIMQQLIDAGASIDEPDARGSTPLHHACAESGSVEAVEILLAKGASTTSRRSDGQSALHIACRGHASPVALLRALVRRGEVSPALRDGDGLTPLMHCAAAGHRQGVGLLLRLAGADAAAATDKGGLDALSHALQGRGDRGVVERLLKAGLAAKGRLPQAARLGEVELLPLLVARGAELEGAVLEASRAGHAVVVRTLLSELNASAKEVDVDGTSALHAAALGGHIAVVEALLAAGAKASEVDSMGMTPLHYVASTGGHVPLRRQQELMRALAAAGGRHLWQQGAAKANGLEPLHLAAANGDAALARWLVIEEAVADPRAQDASGFTPADAAEKAKHAALADLLRSWATQSEL